MKFDISYLEHSLGSNGVYWGVVIKSLSKKSIEIDNSLKFYQRNDSEGLRQRYNLHNSFGNAWNLK